ncbi:chaperone protein DnaJ [Galdieria sulphuraria]|uniref:Chaperone protein DnaJ n=1 Tax=Galdieria sulphuraria TaxID=130081 RepID=M2XZV6_GALSU|nr:chaperone protein DnaJ [Galdieria sulphuraria]EME29119.1 chaperone protein DnaJ [Galdieria sulphuraria]|eukprot:XP_005705639.1 chaperone protein DnaJ [Galdieria sulphuraria]
MILGSYAAGMLGLRTSKFAFGKDLYRAWEAHEKIRGRRPEDIFGKSGEESTSRASQGEPFGSTWEQRMDQARQKEQADRERRAREEFRFRMDEAMKEQMKQAYYRFYRRSGPHLNNIHFGSGSDEEWRRKIFEEILKEVQESMKRAQYKSYRSQKSDSDSFEAWFGGLGGNRFQGYTRGYFYEQAKREQQRQREESTSGVFSAPRGNMYEKLGLPFGASMEQVKEAYRKAARLWHPDTYQGNDPKMAASRFREVNEAYEYLKDPSRKESYDRNSRM